MMKTAIITGVNGQDGQILYDFLIKKKYSILGIDRNKIKTNNSDWQKFKKIDISKKNHWQKIISIIQPTEIYHLATIHHSSQEKYLPDEKFIINSYQINFFSLLHILEAVRLSSTKTKVFYASSSLIFPTQKNKKLNELSPYQPDCIYGQTKLAGLLLNQFYRKEYHLFATTGILFNHESHLRKKQYLSKKVILAAKKIVQDKNQKLVVGNIHAIADWGYAPDYVFAMHLLLQQKKADDYIIATGHKHTVYDFIKTVFKYYGIDPKKYLQVDKKLLTRKTNYRIGDPKKLKKLGWKPTVNFSQMITKLIEN